MSHIPVRTARPSDPLGLRFYNDIESLDREIRRRAFELFQQHGAEAGRELDHWLAAEREFACCPPAEVSELDREFRIRIAVPGLDEKHLKLTAVGRVIALESIPIKIERAQGERILLDELPARRLFRRFELPEEIDPDEVKGYLRNGMLTICALKAASVRRSRAVAVAAHG